MILGEVCHGRDNNLNLIRMVAAAGVLVSHAWPLSQGPQAVEPLQRITGFTLGTLSVFVFFVISGFLIARSFERQSLGRWAAARVLRLFPALVVVLLLTVLVLGPLVTSLPAAAYFGNPQTLSYVPRNLGLAFLQYTLPGVFEGNPYGPAINGSLWTLFYEVVCYGGVLLAGLLGAFRRRWMTALALAALALAYVAVGHFEPAGLPRRVELLLELGLPFAIGTGFYVWRDRLVLHPAILAGLAGITLLAWSSPLQDLLLTFSLSYGVFLLAYGPDGAIRRYNRLGDYSYGVYIYAFPSQQLAMHLVGPMTPLTNVALALPPTLLLAILSWTLIEKPALALVRGGARPAPIRAGAD